MAVLVAIGEKKVREEGQDANTPGTHVPGFWSVKEENSTVLTLMMAIGCRKWRVCAMNM